MARAKKADARTKGHSARSSRSRNSGDGHGDAIAFLKHQHDETRKLFQEIAEAEPQERRELFQQLADVLAAHARIEEDHFYPAIARIEGMEDVTHDSLEEHLIVKRLLNDMMSRDLDETVYQSKCRVLEMEAIRHLDEEEAILFPKARSKMAEDQLEQLGSELEQEYQQLAGSEPRKHVPQEIAGAPPLNP